MNDRLHKVVARVLDIPAENITDEDSPATVESWDSLAHINLVLSLEAEFDVSLPTDEAVEMLSVGSIRTILRERGVNCI